MTQPLSEPPAPHTAPSQRGRMPVLWLVFPIWLGAYFALAGGFGSALGAVPGWWIGGRDGATVGAIVGLAAVMALILPAAALEKRRARSLPILLGMAGGIMGGGMAGMLLFGDAGLLLGSILGFAVGSGSGIPRPHAGVGGWVAAFVGAAGGAVAGTLGSLIGGMLGWTIGGAVGLAIVGLVRGSRVQERVGYHMLIQGREWALTGAIAGALGGGLWSLLAEHAPGAVEPIVLPVVRVRIADELLALAVAAGAFPAVCLLAFVVVLVAEGLGLIGPESRSGSRGAEKSRESRVES